MQRTDKFVALGEAGSSLVITHSGDTSRIAMGGAWGEQDGTKLPVAILKLNC